MLVAFSIREALELPQEIAEHLNDLGFRCPTSGDNLTVYPSIGPLQDQPMVSDRGSAASAPPAAVTKDLTPLMVEICSGSGVLSAAFRDVGFRTLAIDRPGNEHRTPTCPWTFQILATRSCL